ncbi:MULTISPECIES: DUF2321 domain-containing protein [unclassified Clostridium]|uniref:DUF2321 domain-containing protein n=1 Tax=unclassified Clostridium TaxID=2614128 RepID=UPI00291542F6|nr:DUF2321 domain-containing protein [Clostridium sp.]MDU5107566.1 DUF2321 domain-containing protein [Clostridium sp.]
MFDDFYGETNRSKDYTDTALICENGHIINSCMVEYPESNSEYCEKCGAKNISTCPNCKKTIDGYRHVSGWIGSLEIELPSYCKKCGSPFPWTESRTNALNEIVDLMEELSNDEKEDLKQSAVIISTDNPKTQLGAFKIKKYLSKVGKSIGDVARQIIVDVASETALKILKEQGVI